MLASLFPGTRLAAKPLRRGAARGVVPVEVRIATRESPRRRRLVVRAPGAPGYERPLAPSRERVRLDLHLNTHLLANGRQRVTAAIEDERGHAEAATAIALDVRNEGALAERVRASLRATGTPFCVEGPLDSSHYDMPDRDLGPWFDQPDWRDRLGARRAAGGLDERQARVLEEFARDGFASLPVRIEEALLRRIDRELDRAVRSGIRGYRYGSGERLRNLHLYHAGFRELWLHPEVLAWLGLVFEAPARPAQTLTYVFGSEQDPHQDTIHLTPFPAGYMCGVWIALEDVRENSGELVVYPGSHRLPRVYLRGTGCPKVETDDWSEFGAKVVSRWGRMVAEGGFEKRAYRPRRGEVLVWHENLMHGGGPRVDRSLTRRSVVSHYFADGAIAFFDSTGRAAVLE